MSARRTLRLAFIGNPASPHVRRWAEFFAARDHEVAVLEGFGNGADARLDPPIRLVRYDARGKVRLPLAAVLHARRELRRIFSDLRPDIVHAHTVRPYGWQATLAGVHPYVISTWGSDVLLAPPGRRARFWQRRTLSRADLVTAVSPYMREAAIQSGARPDRVELIHFGVDTQRFTPGPIDTPLLARAGISGPGFIFSPRALTPLYNHETVVDAVAHLAGARQLVFLAGRAGTDHLSALRARAAAGGLGDRVRFVRDVSDDDMVSLFRAAGVVVSIPTSDSFPITLLEAMSTGTPIVVGDLPPIRAELGELVPRSLVPTADPEPVASALGSALALGDDERRALGDSLRAHVVATADRETHMLRMEELYLGLARP